MNNPVDQPKVSELQTEIINGLREDYRTVRKWSGSALVAGELGGKKRREDMAGLYSDLCALGNSLDYYADKLALTGIPGAENDALITTRWEEAGFVEFINEDVPTIVRDLDGPAAVLLDMTTRKVVGYRVYDPAPAPTSGAEKGEAVAIRWQKAMAARHRNRDLPDFSLPASEFPDYRTGGGGTLVSPGDAQKCIRQDCDCFDKWDCSRRAIAADPTSERVQALGVSIERHRAGLAAALAETERWGPDADHWSIVQSAIDQYRAALKPETTP